MTVSCVHPIVDAQMSPAVVKTGEGKDFVSSHAKLSKHFYICISELSHARIDSVAASYHARIL
jgi:hypothetical protein